MIEIISAKNKRQLRQFIDFPHDLYADDPSYIPMLYKEQEALLNPRKSAFWKHSKADYFLAKQRGRIVGRLAAIRNNKHIQFTGRPEGFFGFFDVEPDFAVAKRLFDAATEWLRKEELIKMIGPTNFSTNNVAGLLVENFDEPPFIMNPYNALYYVQFIEKYGFTKMVDLLCYELMTADVSEETIARGEELEISLAKKGITFRTIDMRNYKREIDDFLLIYNASWAENTGFVPMTEAEIYEMARYLKPLIDPDFMYFAEKEGKTIGVSLAVPNLNQIQIGIKRGRLFPFGALKLLFGLKKITGVRIIALGTLKKYRRLGIDLCFYVRNAKAARRKGMTRHEASWILEDNILMNRGIERMNGRVYRKYRLYEKQLSANKEPNPDYKVLRPIFISDSSF